MEDKLKQDILQLCDVCSVKQGSFQTQEAVHKTLWRSIPQYLKEQLEHVIMDPEYERRLLRQPNGRSPLSNSVSININSVKYRNVTASRTNVQ